MYGTCVSLNLECVDGVRCAERFRSIRGRASREATQCVAVGARTLFMYIASLLSHQSPDVHAAFLFLHPGYVLGYVWHSHVRVCVVLLSSLHSAISRERYTNAQPRACPPPQPQLITEECDAE